MSFINYAHRGASEYAPENTFPSFSLGVAMKANGVETDVQRTRDGVLVLFHDNDLMRICGRPEAIGDLTYTELRELDFGLFKGENYRNTKIPTFEEFLISFGNKYDYFAIEIKERGVEEETLSLIKKYLSARHVVITSGIWSSLLTVRKIDKNMKTGYLAKYLSDELISEAKKSGIYQICPKASILTPDWNNSLRNEGFSVRAWGIDNVDTMNMVLEFEVDGMTINYPDVLQAELYRRGLNKGN